MEEHSSSSLWPAMRGGVQCDLFGFQFIDQLLSSIDRHPIENLALNPPIAIDVPIGFIAFFAHGICASMRRPRCHPFL